MAASSAKLLFFLWASNILMAGTTSNDNSVSVYRVVKTIDRLLVYYDQNIKDMSAETMLGFKILEGLLLNI